MDRLLKKGLITSIIGLLIIGFCGVLVYQSKQSPESMSGWIAMGLMFLRSKDSILFGEPK